MIEQLDLHFVRAPSQDSVVTLLREHGLEGYVFPPKNGWITLVVDGPPFQCNEALAQSHKGDLLHVHWSEEYGWGFEVFQNGSRVCRFQCKWGDRLRVQKSGLNLEWLSTFFEGRISASQFQEIVDPGRDPLEYITMRPAERFIRLAGLRCGTWNTFTDVLMHFSPDNPSMQGIIEVA